MHEEKRLLKRTRNAPLGDLMRFQISDILSTEYNLTARQRELTSNEIEHGGLARAIGTDQCMARSGFETEVNVVGDPDGAELLHDADRFQRRGHRRRSRSITPRMPPRANKTVSTRIKPIQKFQNSGSLFASWSWAIM